MNLHFFLFASLATRVAALNIPKPNLSFWIFGFLLSIFQQGAGVKNTYLYPPIPYLPLPLLTPTYPHPYPYLPLPTPTPTYPPLLPTPPHPHPYLSQPMPPYLPLPTPPLPTPCVSVHVYICGMQNVKFVSLACMYMHACHKKCKRWKWYHICVHVCPFVSVYLYCVCGVPNIKISIFGMNVS